MTGPGIFCRSTLQSFVFGTAVLGVISNLGAPAIAQDIGAGKRVFNQCRACHRVGEKARNGVGPILNGLFGRKAGTAKGYNFSKANKTSGVTWDEAAFRKYIENPRKSMPGTKMAYPGLKRKKQIDDLVAYLKQFAANGTIKTK